MSDDDVSFIIDDSDNDISSERSKKENSSRKSDGFESTTPDSDDEFLDDDNKEEDDVSNGRMTPLIRKAIRRSIMNISRQLSESDNDDEEENEDASETSNHSLSVEDSDSEVEITRPRRRRVNRFLDDTSDEEDSKIVRSTPRGRSHKSQEKSLHSSKLEHLNESREEDDEVQTKPKNSARTDNLNSTVDYTDEDDEQQNKSKSSLKIRSFADIVDETSEEDEVENTSKKHSKPGNLTGIIDETDEEHEDNLDSDHGSHPANDSSCFSKKKDSAKRSTNLQQSDSRQSQSLIFTDDSSEEGPQSPLMKEVSPRKYALQTSIAQESEEDIQEVVPPPKKSAEVIAIDSDTPSDNSSHDKTEETSQGEITAMSFAQEELGLNKIDPVVAQNRAMIVFQLRKAETELSRLKVFLKEGQLQYLPDQGDRLIKTAKIKESEVADLRAQLARCRLVEEHSPEEIKETSPLHGDTYEYSQKEEVQDPIDKPFTFNDKLMKRPTIQLVGEMGKKALETFQREQALTVETIKSFHGSLTSRPADNEQAEDPKGLKVNLLPHQKHALAWLTWRESQKPPGGVLADDMGLGKTLTMISLVLKANEERNSGGDSEDEWYSNNKTSKHLGGTLVVCPASLIGQWEDEVKKHVKKGLLNIELYHGNKRENVAKRLARNDIVITTYNLVSREHKTKGVLYRLDWKRIILDEGHVIRNHKSQVCEAVCALAAKNRWVLTGTPIHNKEMDLFSILKFLECAPFNDIRVWKRWVDNKNQAGHDRLAAVMKTLMLRRTKQELINSGALDTLPEKFYEEIMVTMDRDERDVYEKVMLYSKTIFAQFLHQRAEKQHMFAMGAGAYDMPYVKKNNPFNKAQQKLLSQHADVKSHQILLLLLRLRQICIHPSLVNAMLDQEDIEANDIEGMGSESDLTQKMNKLILGPISGDADVPDGPAEVSERVSEHLLTSDNPVFEKTRKSSKVRALLQILKKIMKETSDKVIVVSQWTSVLNIIGNMLANVKGATFKSLTGAVQVKDRGSIVDAFNNDKNPRILLLSLTAGGVGLNLVGANHLVMVDNHWNPQLESQAQDRIYRFGQKKDVFIYKLLCQDTIEERIKAMQEKKLELAKNVLSGTGKITSSKLSLDELKSLFGM